LGTAIAARLFQLTQPALMQLPWFARNYNRWITWKNRVTERVRQSLAWRKARFNQRRVRRHCRKQARVVWQQMRAAFKG